MVLLQAFIGPEGGAGEEAFDFLVCSPAWILDEVRESGFLLGRHHLVVRRFDLQLIRGAIEEICSHARGESWSEIAARIGRYGKWEFEDYRG